MEDAMEDEMARFAREMAELAGQEPERGGKPRATSVSIAKAPVVSKTISAPPQRAETVRQDLQPAAPPHSVSIAPPAPYGASPLPSSAPPPSSSADAVDRRNEELRAATAAVAQQADADRQRQVQAALMHQAPGTGVTAHPGMSAGDKKQPVKRAAAGDVWVDETLADWPENDFRLFVGNLGNDATDQLLATAFSKYPSFQRARVVRDKRANKPKGYGFVSFKEPWDMTRAMREMENKYVGSRPVKLKKSTWQDRSFDSRAEQQLQPPVQHTNPAAQRKPKRQRPIKWP